MAADSITYTLAGAVIGLIGTQAGNWIKVHIDRANARSTERERAHLEFLDPLQYAASDLREQLAGISQKLAVEASLAENDLQPGQHVRWWFRAYKGYVVNSWPNANESAWKHEISMHAGGMGYHAASTLYLTARYLFYSTRARNARPYVMLNGGSQKAYDRLEEVRESFAQLEFYPVTQDTTGALLKGSDGLPLSFDQFMTRLGNSEDRGWLLTLTDVYFKIHNHLEGLGKFEQSLGALGSALQNHRARLAK